MKISFKKVPASTGLASIGEGKHTDIKLDKKKWGTMFTPSALSSYKDQLWRISFAIMKKDIMEDKNPNCPWKNVTLKHTFETEDATRLWLKDNLRRLLEMFTPHLFED